MKPIVVHNWGQLIENIAECMQAQNNVGLWWRGLANSEWPLVPFVYRESYHNSEQTTHNNFMNKGKTRHSLRSDVNSRHQTFHAASSPA